MLVAKGREDASIIATRVQACLVGFRDASTSLSSADAATKQKLLPYDLNDEIGRFRLWCGNIAAHRIGRSSLDYRLREASHIKERVLELLQNLHRVILEATELIRGERLSWEELSDSDSDLSDSDLPPVSSDEDGTTELQQLLSNVAEIITCLMRLSIAIRNPAPHDQYKESSHIDTSYYEDFDVQHVRGKFPDAEDFLVHRLGKAISRRRQYLHYRDDHHKKLQKDIEVPPPLPSVASDIQTEAPAPTTTVISSQKIESTVASSIPLAFKSSATAIQFNENDYYEDVLSQTSYASSTDNLTKLRPPPLPEQGQDGNPFECPLCFRFTSVRQLSAWHKHIYRDLQPYVCVFKNCTAGDHMYESRYNWFMHELQEHRKVWECIEGCNQRFETESSFSEHIQEGHPDMASGSHLDDLMRSCERQRDMSAEADCPLCNQTVSSLTQLRRHLGKHHEELALFALPSHMRDEVDEDDDHDSSRSLPSLTEGSVTKELAIFICEHCDKEFPGEPRHEILLEHMKGQHAAGMIICEAIGCLKMFPDRDSLITHKRLHALRTDRVVGEGAMKDVTAIPWRLCDKRSSRSYIDDCLMAVGDPDSDPMFLDGREVGEWVEIPADHVLLFIIEKSGYLHGTALHGRQEILGLEAQHWHIIHGPRSLLDIQKLKHWAIAALSTKSKTALEIEVGDAALPLWFYKELRTSLISFEDKALHESTVPRSVPRAVLLLSMALMNKDVRLSLEGNRQLVDLYRITLSAIEIGLKKDDIGLDTDPETTETLRWFLRTFRRILSARRDEPGLPENQSIQYLTEMILSYEKKLGNVVGLPELTDELESQPEAKEVKAMSFSVCASNLPVHFKLEILESFLESIFQSKYPSYFRTSITYKDWSGTVKLFVYLHFKKEEERNRAVLEMQNVQCGGRQLHLEVSNARVDLPDEAERNEMNQGNPGVVEYSDQMPPPPWNCKVKMIVGSRSTPAILTIGPSGMSILDVSTGSELVKSQWEHVKAEKVPLPGSRALSIIQSIPTDTTTSSLIRHNIETLDGIQAWQIAYDMVFWNNRQIKSLQKPFLCLYRVRTRHDDYGTPHTLELNPSFIVLRSREGYQIFRKRWKTIAQRSDNYSEEDAAYKIHAVDNVVRSGKWLPFLENLKAESHQEAAGIANYIAARMAEARAALTEIAPDSHITGGSDDGDILSESESLDPYDPLHDADIVSVESDTVLGAHEIMISHYHRHWRIPWVKCHSGDQAEDFIHDVVYGGSPPDAGFILGGPYSSSGHFWISNWEEKVHPGSEVVIADLHEGSPRLPRPTTTKENGPVDPETPHTESAQDDVASSDNELTALSHSGKILIPSDPKISASDSKMYTATVRNMLPEPSQFNITIGTKTIAFEPIERSDSYHSTQWFVSKADIKIVGELVDRTAPETSWEVKRIQEELGFISNARPDIRIEGRFYHYMGSTVIQDAENRVVEVSTANLREAEELALLLGHRQYATAPVLDTVEDPVKKERSVEVDAVAAKASFSSQHQNVEHVRDRDDIDTPITAHMNAPRIPFLPSPEMPATGLEGVEMSSTSPLTSGNDDLFDDTYGFFNVSVLTHDHPEVSATKLELLGEDIEFTHIPSSTLFSTKLQYIDKVVCDRRWVFLSAAFRKQRGKDTGVESINVTEEVTIEAKNAGQAANIEAILNSKIEGKQGESRVGTDEVSTEAELETRGRLEPPGKDITATGAIYRIYYILEQLQATPADLSFESTYMKFAPIKSPPATTELVIPYNKVSDIAHSPTAKMISCTIVGPVLERLKLIINTEGECSEIHALLSAKVAEFGRQDAPKLQTLTSLPKERGSMPRTPEGEPLVDNVPPTLQDPDNNPSRSTIYQSFLNLYEAIDDGFDGGSVEIICTTTPRVIYFRTSHSSTSDRWDYAYGLDLEHYSTLRVLWPFEIKGEGYLYKWDEEKKVYVLTDRTRRHSFSFSFSDLTEGGARELVHHISGEAAMNNKDGDDQKLQSETHDPAIRLESLLQAGANTHFKPVGALNWKPFPHDPSLPTVGGFLSELGDRELYSGAKSLSLHYTASHILFSTQVTPANLLFAIGLHGEKNVLEWGDWSSIITGQGYQYLSRSGQLVLSCTPDNGKPALVGVVIEFDSPDAAKKVIEGIREKCMAARAKPDLQRFDAGDLYSYLSPSEIPSPVGED